MSSLLSVDLGLFREEWRGQRLAGKLKNRRLVPFDTRSQITKGSLAGKNLEIIYVDDPVEAFFLHVQGSGRVVLEDGTVIRVGYAAQNGRDYVSIGRELVKNGDISLEDVSLQSIRRWLKKNPDKVWELLDKNPSFVFFREIDGAAKDQGPLGAQNVPLTPGRSLAVDRAFIPLGLPVYLDTVFPGQNKSQNNPPNKPLQRLLITQDTGGAIKGPVRGDVFFGFGKEAEELAGYMKEEGQYYLLLPKTVSGPIQSVAQAE